MSSIFLAYLAGAVTILSPCVLPLLPIVLGGAITQHRLGPLALAAGLVVSFAALGLFLATAGLSLGITAKLMNQIAAAMMIVFGLVLMSAQLQERFAVFASTATSGVSARVSAYSGEGLTGQFILGSLLGAVWTPCVGPTLGAAIALAAQGQSVGYAGTVMFAFALGTVTPLIILMTLTRDALLRRREGMMAAGRWMKSILGVLLVVLGILFITGLMSEWEAFVLDRLPAGLINFIYGI